MAEQSLHGQFHRQVAGTVDTRWQWYWLKQGNLLKETEGFLMTAQEQALSTNVMRSKNFNLPVSSLCRLCGSADETMDHLISSCHYIAQSQYKKYHKTS